MNRIAVALHDVEPATFECCALIRDWLADLGIDRATLLVIPAPDLHPFADQRPELAAWLAERARLGDAVAQRALPPVRAPLLWPRALRAGAFLAGPLLRLDLHPGDLERPKHVWAVERIVRGAARRREVVTYDDVAGC